jgi:DNA-binding XRE family transcriptional regulator
MTNDGEKTIIQELQWVRKPLMLQALAVGYKQKHLAAALGVSTATISRMMPKGFAKYVPSGQNTDPTEN